jgi:hypothetical protein
MRRRSGPGRRRTLFANRSILIRVSFGNAGRNRYSRPTLILLYT